MCKRTLLVAVPALVIAGLAVASPLAAQTCNVCVGTAGAEGGDRAASRSGGARAPEGSSDGQIEQTALLQSLADLGFSTVVTDDPATETCTVAVSYPGCDSCFGAPDISWVQGGFGYVQISDWGPGFQANDYDTLTEGASIEVEVVDGGHPITQGLPAQWTTRGFWRYGYDVEDYVGWVEDPDANLGRADGHDLALATRAEGAGRLAYVGWNVYGSEATAPDLAVLSNAIQWAGQCQVAATADWIEVPTLSHGALAALAALLAAAAIFVLNR